MKIKTNSKNIENLIMPTTPLLDNMLVVGTKIKCGNFTSFDTKIVGHYKGGGTKTLLTTGDYGSYTWSFTSDGRFYKYNTMDSGEYSYLEITNKPSGASINGVGEIE